MSTDLPLVELVTRDLDGTCELVTAVRVGGGPVLEVPEGSRVAVEYLAGASLPTVHVELLAARVRHVPREAVLLEGEPLTAQVARLDPPDLTELRSRVAHHRPTSAALDEDLCAACSGRWPCVTARLLAEVDRRGRHVHELATAALELQEADRVLEWDVVDGGVLGALVPCPDCAPRDPVLTGGCELCSSSGALHRPYRLPDGSQLDLHRPHPLLGRAAATPGDGESPAP